MFNIRILLKNQPCQLSILMRYGLVQVLNAALTLINDEDFHIRQKSVRFVGQLQLDRDDGADDNKVEDRGRIGKKHALKK